MDLTEVYTFIAGIISFKEAGAALVFVLAFFFVIIILKDEIDGKDDR